MVGKRDGEPPLDNNAEKIPQPKVGQVYKLNRKYTRGYDFVKIVSITPAENDKNGKARIQLAKWEENQWKEVSFAKKMLLSTFIEKNDQHNYSFVHDSVEDFYATENIDRPVDPIRAFEELGEPWAPVEKEEVSPELPQAIKEEESVPQEELILTPEQELREPEEQEAEITAGRLTGAERTEVPAIAKPEPQFIDVPPQPEAVVAPVDLESVPESELTPEQKKRRALGERLELSPEQLAERDILEKRVDNARDAYVTSLYAHEQSLGRVLSILNLKRNPEPDAQYKIAYEEALKNLQEFDTLHLQEYFLESKSASDESWTSSARSYLERYNRLEAVALWAEQQEVRAKHKQDGWEQLEQSGKVGEVTKRLVDKVQVLAERYQKLSFGKKITIGGALLGIHAGIAFVSAPAAIGAASLWLGAKVVTGTAAYKSTSKLAEAGVQKFDSFLGNRKDKKDEEKIFREVQFSVTNNEGFENFDKYLEKINDITQQSIKNLDTKLAFYEKRNFWLKAASLGVIFGIPVARYLGDVAGVGAEAVSVPTDVSETESVIASDHAPQQVPESGANTTIDAGTKEGTLEASPKANEAVPNIPPKVESSGLATEGEPSVPAPELAFTAATVTEGDRAKGLWGIVQRQLPENMDSAEKNRVAASVQNLIQNKLQNLTDAQIQDQYGFRSKDINLIKPGEVIKLDQLVTKDELREIVEGKKIILPLEGGVDAPETPSTPPVEVPQPSVDVPVETPAATPHPSDSLSSEVIGFKSTPVPADEQYWKEIRRNQGNYASSDGFRPASYRGDMFAGESVSETQSESASQIYTYEMSKYQSLPVESRELLEENKDLLRNELLDLNHPEFGPHYHPGAWKSAELWRLHKDQSMPDIVAFDQPRFDYDPRDSYRDFQERQIGRRGIYFAPTDPQPQLGDGPDARAIHSMERVEQEYRHNLADMHKAAFLQWGNVAHPIKNESVEKYVERILTLYTRTRLENPDFRLKF